MSEKNEHRKSSSNAFLWGMIIGGIIVYLFTTKRGKRILKQLSEMGFETLENISEFEGADEYTNEETDEVEENQEELHENGNGHSPRKRFFKGIKKRF